MSFSPDSRIGRSGGVSPESQQAQLPRAEELGSNWWEVAHKLLLEVFKTDTQAFPITKATQLSHCRAVLTSAVLQVHIPPLPSKEHAANTDPARCLTHTIQIVERDLPATMSDKQLEQLILSELLLPVQSALGEFASRIALRKKAGSWSIQIDLNTDRIRREIHHQPSHRKLWALPAEAHGVIGRNPNNLDSNQVGVQLDGNAGLSRSHLEAWFKNSSSLTQKPSLMVRDLQSSNGSVWLYPDEVSYESLSDLFEKQATVRERRVPPTAVVVEPYKTLCLVGPHIVRAVPVIAKFFLRQGRLIVETYQLDPPVRR